MTNSVRAHWLPLSPASLPDERGFNALLAGGAERIWLPRRSHLSSVDSWQVDDQGGLPENGAWYFSSKPGRLLEVTLGIVSIDEGDDIVVDLPASLSSVLESVGASLAVLVEHDGGALVLAARAATLARAQERLRAMRGLAARPLE